MLSHFFIDRPIFSLVISIIIVLGGMLSMVNLPIAQFPEVTLPQIQVIATYPGASAEVVSQNVAAPIEQQVNGADGMVYMYSTASSTGNVNLTVFFNIDRDPDLAQVDVQNRVNLAMPQLPEIVSRQGVSVVKVSNNFLMLVTLYSPDGRFDTKYVANYANLYVLDAIKRIPGANQSIIWGATQYAMRLWVKPDRMAQLKVTAQDIVQAVRLQNEQFAVGSVGRPPVDGDVLLTFPVTTKGRLATPEEFENIIIRAGGDGAPIIRLKDVGSAELGIQDYSLRTQSDNKEAALIVVWQQPGANSLEVSREVRALMEKMKQNFPEGIDYAIPMDTTKFVDESIKEVVITFFEASFLVIVVVLLFLGTLRATMIPIAAIPVSILGAFIGLALFGFSINMLTLFALVLAIGVVVDDAIVVMENVERNMTRYGLSARDAAKKAMNEVTGPIIATTLVVLAVFIPVALLGGITGQLYKQFAITIAVAVVFSLIVALTLSPAMAAYLLRGGVHKKGFFLKFDTFFEGITNYYVNGVRFVLERSKLFMLGFVGFIFAVYFLFNSVPASFVPEEDQGYLFGIYMLPDGASLDRTSNLRKKAVQIMLDHPAVESVASGDGYSLLDNQLKINSGAFFVSLKDFSERRDPSMKASAVVADTWGKYSEILEGIVMPIMPPSVPGLGAVGGFEFWIQSQGSGTIKELAEICNLVAAKAKDYPELGPMNLSINPDSMQLLVELDREKAETLGIAIQDVYDTLQTLFGSLYVSQFNKDSRLWQVIVQAESKYRTHPDDIDSVYVRNRNGEMVPLSSVVKINYSAGADIVTRFNNFPAAKINGGAAPGYTSGQAINAMERLAREVLPGSYGFAWSGQAFEEIQSGGTSTTTFIFGMIMIFLILAAQYEKWSLPFAIILAMPFTVFGAIFAVYLTGLQNDIYFQIGLVALIALAAKNAILIVEFASVKRKEGLSIFDASLEAARLRLRPIIMTAFTFILGVFPLAIATGAASASRHSIGTGVIGGMLAATLIAIFYIPLFFYLIQSFSERYFPKAKE